MQDPNWQRIKELFAAAATLPPEQRAELLHAATDDPIVRAEVESLLAAHAPTVAPDPAAGTTPGEGLGSRIGPYKLLEVIGEGGFGSVYAAEQEAPVRRRVALKIIKAGMDSRQVVARFEQERQALALMDHPNIARVFDGGSTPTGRPFFVMELVKGDPITEYCDREKLTPSERLRLFIDVGRAVQHAHQKGVIHRDLKPNNVLVTIIDGRAIAKVIDFGVAKATQGRLTDKTLFTEHRQMIGTPLYMSPEQAHISGVDVDTRSDVYGLGVLLYELLTGTTPFRSEELLDAGLAEMHRVLREVEPPMPSTRVATLGKTGDIVAAKRRVEVGKLSPMLRGDLDWIVMKCLEKERARRYETASALVRDVERHLEGEAVEAAPPSVAYRVSKFVRRRKGQVAAAAAVLLVGAVGLGAFLWSQRLRADEAIANLAQQERLRVEREAIAYADNVQTANAASTTGNAESARRRLAACPDPLRGWEWHYVAAKVNAAVAAFRDRRLLHDIDWELDVGRHWYGETVDVWDSARAEPCPDPSPLLPGPIACATKLPLGSRFVCLTISDDRIQPVVVDVIGNRPQVVHRLPKGDVPVSDNADLRILRRALNPYFAPYGFSPDGGWLFIDHALVNCSDWTTRELPTTGYVAFSPDGSQLAVSTATDPLLYATAGHEPPVALRGHDAPIQSLRFSEDGRWLITAAENGCIVWGTKDGTPTPRFRGASTSKVFDACLAPDCSRVLVATEDGIVRVWSVSLTVVLEEVLEGELRGHRDAVLHTAFSPDGRWIATASRDGTVGIWRTSDLGLQTMLLHDDMVHETVWSPDGQWLVTSDCSQTRRIWHEAAWSQQDIAYRSSTAHLSLTPENWSAGSLWFSTNGQALHCNRNSFDSDTGLPIDVAYASDMLVADAAPPPGMGGLLARNPVTKDTVSISGSAVRETASRFVPNPMTKDTVSQHDDPGSLLVLDPAGNLLAKLPCRVNVEITAASLGGPSTLVTVEDRRGSSGQLATMGIARIWEIGRPEPLLELPADPSLRSVHVSWDGTKVLLVAERPRIVLCRTGDTLVELATDKIGFLLAPTPHGQRDWAVSNCPWSPDGQWIVWKTDRDTLASWNAASGAVVHTLVGHTSRVTSACFHPTEPRVATSSEDCSVRIWDNRTGRELLSEHFPRRIHRLAFSPDGAQLATLSEWSELIVLSSRMMSERAKAHREVRSTFSRVGPHLEAALHDTAGPRLLRHPSLAALSATESRAAAIAACRRDLARRETLAATLKPLLLPDASAESAAEANRQLDVDGALQPACNLLAFWRGVVAYRSGDFDSVLRQWREYEVAPRDDLQELHRDGILAMAHSRLGHREEAIACLDRLQRGSEHLRHRAERLRVLGEARHVFTERFGHPPEGK